MLAAIEAAFAEHDVIFIEAGDSQSGGRGVQFRR
jgi:hypothetical protein